MADKTVNRFGTAKGVMIADPLSVTALDLSTLALPSAAGEVDLQDFKNLVSLNLTGSSPTKLNLKGLASLATITGINGNTSLKEIVAEGCAALTSLNVAGCSILDAINMAGCSLLTTLNASGTGFTVLDLTGTAVTNLNISNAASLASLTLPAGTTTLNISGTGLSSLSVNGVTTLTCDVTLVAGLSDYSAVTSLTLTGSGTDLSLIYLWGALTSLDLSGATNLQTLALSGSGLTTLTLTGKTTLTSLSIYNCNNLVTINANGCTSLTSCSVSSSSAMQNVYLQNSGLTTCTLEIGGIVNLDVSGSASLTSMGTIGLGQIEQPTIAVNCSGCALYSYEVNALMASGVNSGLTGPQKSIDTSGGTNGAPTKQGVTDVNTLLGRGWNITTN